MSKGNLIINVYFETIAEPVAGALVSIKGEGFEAEYVANADGKIGPIELPAPDIKYSLMPQSEVRPYSTYDLTVRKEGMRPLILKNIEILPTETSIQDVFMHIGDTPEVIELPDHDLWGEHEQKIPEDPIKDENATMSRVLPIVLIPEYIIVHDGAPASNATNYVVPFIDYIKNVASSEIFSTWPVESLKANVHAIVSFTMNRIFTEWYRARGYNFTITSVPTYDQKYTHNRTIFQSISNVVDQYFRYYIRLSGMTQPFLAQYNDGIISNNSGWLSQWGSKELADRGYKAIDILKHYYTPNLTLEVAPEVVGLPDSFPGFNMSVGSCGAAVQTAQIRLNRIRGNYPGIPAISPADGQYGESTRNTVRTFQSVFSLPVTGVIDIATWFKISYVFGAVAKLAAGV